MQSRSDAKDQIKLKSEKVSTLFDHFVFLFRIFGLLDDLLLVVGVVKLFQRGHQVHQDEGDKADEHHHEQEVEERVDGKVRRLDHLLRHDLELKLIL